MNKRILKLFGEAGFHQPAMEREEGLEAKFDKFAELIVKECALVAWKHTPDDVDQDISGKIKEHFGIE